MRMYPPTVIAMLCVAAVTTLAASVRAEDASNSKAPQAGVSKGQSLAIDGDSCYEGRKLSEWTKCLRKGRCEELERYSNAALAVWQYAARDEAAASRVHAAMVTRFRGEAWTAVVYQSMLDSPGAHDRSIAVDALLSNKRCLQASAPILVKSILNWANSEDPECHDLVNSSLTSIRARGPLPVAETLRLAEDLYPRALEQQERLFWSWKLMQVLAPCGREGAELALKLFANQLSRSFAQQIYVHYADCAALKRLAEVCENRQHSYCVVAARLLEVRISIQGIDQPSFSAPALKANKKTP